MIERIIEYSVRNALVVIVLAVAVACWGVYAVFNTPVDAIPDLSENQVIVFADWMGRSPREVEDQVTYPLSVNLEGLAGVKTVRATSEFGFSMINIIFDDDVDFYFARQRVLERLSIAGTFLPPGVTPYLAPDATALGQIFWYTVEGEGYDPGRLRAIQDWFVRYQLSSVPGVAEVASVGGFPIEYQIDVDPSRLRAYNVTLGELLKAVERSNAAVGGRIIQKAGAEYLVRSVGWIASLDDVENIVIRSSGGTPVRVANVARVQYGSGIRRASLEKNGSETVGGVVLMRYGENPLAVTERVKQKIDDLQRGLPEGVRIVPFYDRTRLIHDAIHTVSGTLVEEMIVASLAILLILWHFGSALVVCVTLPMAVLISFILMRLVGVPSNIMSLSGIAIAIGVLVDAAIVMVENVTHHLHARYGSQPVRGDLREAVLPALRSVGRPIFFSVMIMVISFIPVFALGGMEGRMFHPLAFTKTFAMVGVAILAVTLVPAMIPLLVRGRLRSEQESWIVRSLTEIYRPVLSYLLEHPWPIVVLTGAIGIVAAAPYGSRTVSLVAIAVAMLGTFWAVTRRRRSLARAATLAGSLALLAVIALVADTRMSRLGREFMPPLDEGTLLDMPVTVPRASITQVTDDLKARNAILRTFPEVEQVVGKAGRAETPTDPAPPDMIETIINLRPRALWPKRKLHYDDARRQTEAALEALVSRGWVKLPGDTSQRERCVNDATMHALERLDETLRALTLQRFAELEHELAPRLTHFAVKQTVAMLDDAGKLKRQPNREEILAIAQQHAAKLGPRLVEYADLATVRQLAQLVGDSLVASDAVAEESASDLFAPRQGAAQEAVRRFAAVLGTPRPTFHEALLSAVERERDDAWAERVDELNGELFDQAAGAYAWESLVQLRAEAVARGFWQQDVPEGELQPLRAERQAAFARSVLLWPNTKDELQKEMDSLLQVPGWGNIWTQPIINRVDMLATGVRTMVGVKVFGDDLQKIQDLSNRIAAVLRGVPGAVDVQPDQIVGEGYLEIRIDRQKAARYGINVGDIQDVVETALGGKVITVTVEGRERFPVRIRYARAFREDEESVKNLLVGAGSAASAQGTSGELTAAAAPTDAIHGAMGDAAAMETPRPTLQVPLAQLADVRIVEGPSMIKSENGLLRAYVQLNVRDRDVVGFVEEARRAVAANVAVPPGMFIEWSGQFEHQERAARTLAIIWPLVVLLIFVILYLTYHDLADALLMVFSLAGAAAGGVLFQWLFGFNFSVAVQIGYIACFGLATETGVVMLVYLREAVAERGDLEHMSHRQLREAVVAGAVHRLRPKLLTEGTTIIGLAPMLWATGTGAEIMRPMAAPVLGGILVADEVIDLLLPVLFYRVRRWRRRRLIARRKLCRPAEQLVQTV